MPTEQTQDTAQVNDNGVTTNVDNSVVATADLPNPFDDTSWEEKPKDIVADSSNTEPTKDTDIGKTGADKDDQNGNNPDEEIVDGDAYLKSQLGYDTWDAAKQEIEELRKLRENAQTTAEIKFANEQSEKLFLALKEGKEEDVYSFFTAKRELEKVANLDVTKPSDAAQLIKLNLKFKHQADGLNSDEIDYLFQERYSIPAKPVQSLDETDDEYAEVVTEWENKVKMVEKRMVIDAKLAKPEIDKFKTELVLPDIQKAPETNNEPTPEELEKVQKNKDAYLTAVQKSLEELSGINVMYKDEEVEIPIAYEISNENKAKLKPILENLYSSFDYLFNRWKAEDGSFDAKKIASDILLLEDKEMIFQKIANEAGAKRIAHQIKTKSNIQVGDGASGQQRVSIGGQNVTPFDSLAAEVWGN